MNDRLKERLVKILPIHYFYFAFVLTLVFSYCMSEYSLDSRIFDVIGIVLLVMGVFLNLAADRVFKKEGITVKPLLKSKKMVRVFPFNKQESDVLRFFDDYWRFKFDFFLFRYD